MTIRPPPPPPPPPNSCSAEYKSAKNIESGFGNQFIFGYEVEVELPIQLENGNEVEYE